MTEAFHLQVAESADAAQWDAAVQRFDGGIFHTSTWAKYIQAQHPNVRPCFVRLHSDHGDTVGLALAFAERSPRKLLGPLTGMFRTDAAPLVAEGPGDIALAFASSIEDYARSQGLAAIRIGSFGGNAGMMAFDQRGFQPIHCWEFAFDLSACEEALWQRMEYKRRKNIRKAKRLGVVLEDHHGEEGTAELRRLQGASSRRIVARGGRDITSKVTRSADPIHVLLDSGLARIVCARVNGRVVSAGLFTRFNDVVYHTLSGHAEEALTLQAPTFLLWETIKRCKAEGARRFNFGGCSVAAAEEGHPEHGVYLYKRDFGGDRIDCIAFHKVLFPVRHRLGVLLRSVALRGPRILRMQRGA